MKIRILARISAFGVVLGGTFLAGARAQTRTESPILKWPGQTEPLHWHMYPSVFAINGMQAALTNHTAAGATNRQRQYEDADWSAPQCRTMPAKGPHQVTDVDSFPVHFYRLEFKKMDGKSIETNWAQYKH